jgi:hypothetical protein
MSKRRGGGKLGNTCGWTSGRRRERFDSSDLFSSKDTFSGSRRKEDSVCAAINHRTDQVYPFKRPSLTKANLKPSPSKAAQPKPATPRKPTPTINKRKWEESEDDEDSEEREFRVWKKKREDLKEEWRRSKTKKAQPRDEGEESAAGIELENEQEITSFNHTKPGPIKTSGRPPTLQIDPSFPNKASEERSTINSISSRQRKRR